MINTATLQASFNRPVYRPVPLVGSRDIIPYLKRNGYTTLAVDLNNTLMNQQQGIVRASKGRLKISDFATWDVDLSDKMGMTREAYLTWAWKNAYSELLSEPFPGATQAMTAIKRAGIQVWIVSATVMSAANIRGWLGCAGIPFDKVIRTGDKRGVGDCLIDDSPMTCKAFYDEGLPILRFELAWNRHLSQVKGVKWQ